MATYKEIKGVTVQTRDTDPTVNAGTWASAADMNVAKNAMTGFGATNTAAIGAGGYNGTAYIADTESFNGTSWTEVNNLNASKAYAAGAGTQTAGLFSGGHPGSGSTNTTESWNGTNWTEVNDLNAPHSEVRGCGTQTAAILAGGRTDPYPTLTALCEVWDGTNWTEVNDLNIAGVGVVLAGTSTLAIANSGANPSPTDRQTATELWNGSSWTNSTASNSNHREGGAAGIYTDAVISGGSPSITANTEVWNGTAWTEVNNLSTARTQVGSTVGQQTNSKTSLVFAGETPSRSAATEEWSFPSGPHLNEGDLFLSGGTSLKGFGKAAGIPAGTWGSGTNLPTANRSMGIFGPSTSTVVGGGAEPPPGSKQTNAYSWNGSSWSEIAELNATKNEGVGFGNSSTSGFINKGTNEEWDGSSWTERKRFKYS